MRPTARDGFGEARSLCICADDFGLSEGINQAVLALIERGVVTATSCMVLRSAWLPGARRLRVLPPQQADVGLHLDLTAVDPSPAEAPLRGLVLRSLARQLDLTAVRAAIDAQLDLFEQAMGRAPAHVDGHRHVHQLPGVREQLVEALSTRYPAAPPWLRSTRPAAASATVPAKQRLIHALGGRGLEALARRRGLPMSRHLLGVYGFDGGPGAYRQRLQAWLAQAGDGDVLMCHPSVRAVDGDAVGEARVQELSALALLGPSLQAAGSRVQLRPLSRTPFGQGTGRGEAVAAG
ncbi:MAG: ChbG/HpnK family deacetylase [Rhodocyclaceae bacterium]|nr:ChbG/HpnK family deacetylase [Rhodocyclaceae bacterium]